MYGSETADLDANIRVGDAEREAAAERLRHHHAAGRIDLEEFQERLERCYQATKAGHLRELVADLPRDPERGPRYPGMRMIPLVPIVIAIIVISALSDRHGPHVFLWVFLWFLVVRFWLFPRRIWSRWGRQRGAGGQA